MDGADLGDGRGQLPHLAKNGLALVAGKQERR
jgi:hypothetical protein